MSGNAAGRYAQLQPTRQHYIDRAELHAKVTIPALFVPKDFTPTSKLYTPYQSVGARGVNNLASKLLLSLFPPNTPFFKLSVDEMTLEELTKRQDARAEVDKALAKIEKKIVNSLEVSPVRTSVFEALKQLLVAGNVLLHVPTPNEARVFRLNQFVVKRSPDGTVLEIIVMEKIARAALPEKVRLQLEKHQQTATQLPSDSKDSKLPSDKGNSQVDYVEVYTHVCLKDGKHEDYQEVCGVVIEGSEGSYPEDKSPWIALRFTKIDGEDYGRAYVEEYYGDLWTLECLMESLVDAAAVMAKILFLLDPAGTTREEDVSGAENGAFVHGNKEDIDVLQIEKYPDLQFAKQLADDIIQRLSYAFLLNTAIQRAGERVTAEEIRYMARELEDVLGGVYSIQSQELQLPMIKRFIHALSKKGEIPQLPKQIQPMIVTGLEALGRGHDLAKLDTFVAGLKDLFGPNVVAEYLKPGDYMTRRGVSLGIDIDGLIRTEDEVQANRQQQMAASMGPDVIRAGGQVASAAMKQGQGQS
jgi:hypothetical protein